MQSVLLLIALAPHVGSSKGEVRFGGARSREKAKGEIP